jgi:hypothetical protein
MVVPRFVQQALAGDALTRRRPGRREIAINELALRVKALTGSASEIVHVPYERSPRRTASRIFDAACPTSAGCAASSTSHPSTSWTRRWSG